MGSSSSIHTGRGSCTERLSQGVYGQVWKWLLSLLLTFHWPDPSHMAQPNRKGNRVFLCVTEEEAELLNIRLVSDRQLSKAPPLTRF